MRTSTYLLVLLAEEIEAGTEAGWAEVETGQSDVETGDFDQETGGA